MNGAGGSEATTRGVRVRAAATYEAERSSPREGAWFFSYRIAIENVGTRTVQLLSRLWIITDADGRIERVEGPGVVGETPVIAPGERFEYTSFCPLPTPLGTMEGHYVMLDLAAGERFEARIAPFTLAAPGTIH